jgi:site-specific recombinase XerD
MYRGGLRVDEALSLKPSDVDPRTGSIRVLHGNGDKARVVAVDDGAMATVQRWIDTRRKLGIRTGRLFCTLHGGPVAAVYVRNLMKRLAAKAGVDKRVHPHALRHTHAAELSLEGVPVNVIQQQLGHSSLAVTDRYLRHVMPADVVAMGRARPRWEP